MQIGRFFREQWPYLIGAAGFGGVLWIAIRTRPLADVDTLTPPELTPPGLATAKGVWAQLDGSPVHLVKGHRYRGCVQVPFLVPTSLVVGKLPAALVEKGFTDVRVSRPRPSDWPGVDCDIHVEATWAKDSAPLDRPGAVSLAWELT